jgi:hypothetical protein
MANREGYNKEWYKARKLSGLCTSCDSHTAIGRTMCVNHLLELRRKQAKRRKERKQQGVCQVCCVKTQPNTNYCESCRFLRIEKQKSLTEIRKINNQCIECNKHKSDTEIYQHCDDCRLKKKIERHKIRQIILDHYGQKCNCSCGCNTTNPRHLTLDHIENNGAAHRKEVGTSLYFYRWVIKNNFPDDLQILCFNCNCAKSNYGGCLEEDIKVKTPMPEITPTHPNFI